MKELLGKVGDRINPIVVKEVRQAVNSRIVGGALLLFLGIQMTVMAVHLTAHSDDAMRSGAVDLRAGREVFGIVQGILVGTCILIIPALTGLRLASERSDVNVDLLFITSLSPWKIISGKFAAAGLLAVLIFSACAPFMTFAYVMRGLDVPTILIILLTDFLAVLLGTIFTIFLAAIPASRGFRILLGLIAITGLGLLIAGTISVSMYTLESGLVLGHELLDYSSTEFWLGLVGGTTLVVGAIGLFFVWSIALVSPVSANRALPVRVYTLALWLVTGIGCAIIGDYTTQSEPMLVWGLVSTLLFSFQLIIAVCERSEWGPRITRRIPRRPALRFLAFFFFSGSAGGISFAVVCGLISQVTIAVWHKLFPELHWPHPWNTGIFMGGLILGYTYCYCLTAVLVRRFGKGRGLEPIHTWLITLLLVGLGSVLPFIIGEAFVDRTSRLLRGNDYQPLFLTSPIMAIGNELDSRFDEVELPVVFLLVWAIVVTLLNGRWLLEQITSFRPSKPARAKTLPIVVELDE